MLKINLLPDEKKGKSRPGFSISADRIPRPGELLEAAADPWGMALVVAAAIVILGVSWSWVSQTRQADQLHERIAAAVEDSSRLAGLMTASDSLSRRREAVKGRIQVVSRLQRDRYAWARMLHAIAAALPEPAWLTLVEAERPLPELRVRLEGEAATPQAVTAYVRALEGFAWIRGARLQGTSRLADGPVRGQSFTVTVDYRPAPEGG